MKGDEEDEDDDEDNEHGIKDDDNRLKIPTTLPTFSKKIQQWLIDGDFWITDTSRIQFTSEMAVFYHTNNILLTNWLTAIIDIKAKTFWLSISSFEK